MDEVLNMHQAKTHLSRLVERVESGEEVVLARAGRPVARIVPYKPHRTARTPGALRGRIVIGPGFDAVDEEIARELER